MSDEMVICTLEFKEENPVGKVVNMGCKPVFYPKNSIPVIDPIEAKNPHRYFQINKAEIEIEHAGLIRFIKFGGTCLEGGFFQAFIINNQLTDLKIIH